MENVKVVDSTHYVFIPVTLCRIGRSTMMEFLARVFQFLIKSFLSLMDSGTPKKLDIGVIDGFLCEW